MLMFYFEKNPIKMLIVFYYVYRIIITFKLQFNAIECDH